MSISNYTELKTAVANWLNRSDLTSYIPDFVALAEAKINREIRIAAMESRVRSDAASGDVYVALPSDFLEAIRVSVISSPNRDLDYVAPGALDRMYASNDTGKPYVYTIEGDELRIAPKTDGVYTIELRYFAKFDALSASNTTNWLTSNAPDLLLYMSLAEAEPFLKNDERIALWKGLASEAMEKIKTADMKSRYSGSPLSIRVM